MIYPFIIFADPWRCHITLKNDEETPMTQTPAARRLFRRSALCAAIGAVVASGAHAQSSVQISGIMSVGPAYVSNTGSGGGWRLQNNLNWSNSMAIRGVEDLGGGLRAAFSLAYNINLTSGAMGQGNTAFNKNAWVSIGHRDFGDIQIGRNDEFSAEQCVVSAMCWHGLVFNLHPGNLDRIGGSQLANMVKYVSPDWGPLRVRAYYSKGDSTAGTNTGRASGVDAMYRSDSLLVSATYETIRGASISPFNAGTGFGLTRFYGAAAGPSTSFVLDEDRIATIGARVPLGPFALFAEGSDVKLTYKGNDQSLRTYELGATYNFADRITLNVSGYRSTFTTSRWNNYSVMLNYAFSKRTSVFTCVALERTAGPDVVAQLFQAPSSGNHRQNAFAVGIRTAF
jgi:predicted porin